MRQHEAPDPVPSRLLGRRPGAAFAMEAALAGELLEDLREEFREVQSRGLAELGDGSKTEAILREGDPAVVLAEEGAGLDLMTMGSRGYGPIRGALLGATSSAVIRTAPCPVLITPRGLVEPRELADQSQRELATDS